MGNVATCQDCNCDCDAVNKELATNMPVHSPWDEEISTSRPKVPVAPAVMLPSTVYASSRDGNYYPCDTARGGVFSTLDNSETPETSTPLPMPVDDAGAPWRQRQEADVAAIAPEASGADHPETLSMTFALVANKPIGMHCAKLLLPEPGGTLVVTAFASECVFATTKSGECGIRPGDIIAAVNDEKGDFERMLDVLQQIRRTGGDVTLSILPRPSQFNVRLSRRDDESMGIVVVIREDNLTAIEVQQVMDDGAIPQWNEVNFRTRVVGGDSIIAVNGESAPAPVMMEKLQKVWQPGEAVDIYIRTAPRDAYEPVLAPSAP
eukprot:TRINITY_DN64128_c0_g1_i1.p1 TRINITY_DN64128_c0_g1~~TRINITY_DN64128_c0_g1_i1.p1  ORF type:complete len:321 (+),score=61.44 TRINITY_DN64128_c0_g1_i1:241-1203(+)